MTQVVTSGKGRATNCAPQLGLHTLGADSRAPSLRPSAGHFVPDVQMKLESPNPVELAVLSVTSK